MRVDKRLARESVPATRAIELQADGVDQATPVELRAAARARVHVGEGAASRRRARAPLLASREFATTMDILQNGLAILNGSSTSPSAITDGGGDAFIGACVCVCPRARVPLSVCMNNERTRLRDVLCLSAVSCWT